MQTKITAILVAGILGLSALSAASEHVVLHELSEAKTIYVDDDAELYGDGTSWATAYTFLLDGLDDAVAGDEVRIGQGVYRPNQGIGAPNYGTRTQSDSFELINGVTVRGGYAGVGSADPDVRDVKLYETVLSGDLFENDIDPGPRLGGEALWAFMKDDSRADNSYSVVNGAGTNHTAVLDGVVITGGNATPPSRNSGGAVGGYGGRPMLRDCTLFRNWAFSGGAIENYDTEFSEEEGGVALIGCRLVENAAVVGGAVYNNEASPKIIDCSFIRNTAQRGGAIDGDSGAPLINCTFIENSAMDHGESVIGLTGYGGAVRHSLRTLRMPDCVFAGNSASHGGAVYIGGRASVLVERVLFAGNVAEYSGGAVFVEQAFHSQIFLNCTFADNSAGEGAAVAYRVDEDHLDWKDFSIGNCIFRDGGDEIFSEHPEKVSMRFSNVEGGFEGWGNIDVDPLFARRGLWDDDEWVGGDYHLMSQAGRWDAGVRRWVKDELTSACIDAGDAQSAIMYEPFANGGIVNMGAYGGTAEASKTYFGGPECERIVAGDINGDCSVNLADLSIMALHWLEL